MTITADPREGTAVRTSSNAAMSLTYSDFLYARNEYSDSYGNGVRVERRSLPSDFKPIKETKIPFLIQNTDAVNSDFIIIAEFSEVEGPIPLSTVPNDAPDKTDIKMNDFVVHLMSTDYQVNTVGQFRICQDTQVMRKNVFPDVHVFMQYFTLYDLKARGFVRPFCFGYVTKDHIKLDKVVNYLISEFGKVTSVLEYTNREWFSKELNMYLEKLQNAKDSYIQAHCSTSADGDKENADNQSDEFVDTETVTLDQIAHQYSEILNILTIVQSFENSNKAFCKDVINDISLFLDRNPDSNLVSFLKSNEISMNPNGEDNVIYSLLSESLNIPLLHPLRPKGEPLRPLTVLGGLGAVHLVRKLIQIYNHCKMDTIFSEMTQQTSFFCQHFENVRITPNQQTYQYQSIKANTGTGSMTNSSPGKSSGISSSPDFDDSTASGSDNGTSSVGEIAYSVAEDDVANKRQALNHDVSHLGKKELLQILEKLHISCPVIPDNKSGSYHTVSEEDSDLNVPSQIDTGRDEDCGASSVLESTFDNGSVTGGQSKQEQSVHDATDDNWTELKMNSFSSDEEISLGSSPCSLHNTSEEIIVKIPYWVYPSKKIVQGVPGYGLANFFRRFPEAAHHILFSILLQRTIIICGDEQLSRKVGRIITSLIPLVPCSSGSTSLENSSRSWRLLRWHRGILVQAHIDAYKLIGLCIPEKLEVHDLIPPRLLNLVTILSVEKKTILGGPAYSGQLLQNFEKRMQKHFYNSDVSLLSYIGGIYADIESKVYMYKSLEDKYKKGRSSGNIHLLFKELHLRASDAEIVKHLGSLISDPSECVSIL